MTSNLPRAALLCAIIFFIGAPAVLAEDGYDLWLRYQPVAEGGKAYRKAAAQIVSPENASETMTLARDELARGLEGLLEKTPLLSNAVSRI